MQVSSHDFFTIKPGLTDLFPVSQFGHNKTGSSSCSSFWLNYDIATGADIWVRIGRNI